MATPKSLRFALRDWARALAPSCRDATRLQSRALDEALPLGTRIGLKCHLLHCVWCRRYGRQLRFLREALHGNAQRLGQGIVRPLPAEVRQRIKERLRRELE